MGLPQLREFQIAQKGYATTFPDANTSPIFAGEFRNMFINNVGNADKRQGISSFSSINTSETITGLHELVQIDGTVILFASGGGKIWRRTDSTDVWTLVHTFSSSNVIGSFTMQGKIIFYNGVNRNIFTSDAITFQEIRSILEAGRTTVGTSANGLADSLVTNWVVTNVTQYDLVYYTSLSAYGLVTSVVSARVNHTPVSATADGIGASPGGEPTNNKGYQIIDMVALNIVPVTGQSDLDNAGIVVTGSTASSLKIRDVTDFTSTIVRVGDIVYNSTRNRVTEVTSISTSALGVVGLSGMAGGDEVVLLKSSMPIAKEAHVHFERAYLVDGREPNKLRTSGPNNPQDMGSKDAGTLDISTLQPTGEQIKSLHSYQRFFMIGTTRNIYFYEGSIPVSGPAGAANLDIIGSFNTGVLSRFGLDSVGNEAVFVTNTGIQSASLRKTSGQITKKQASFQLDKTLRTLLQTTPEDQIVMVHYPRRSWLIVKIGSEMYIYNYSTSEVTQSLGGAQPTTELFGGGGDVDPSLVAWHVFDGPFARQSSFLVRQNGDLICGSTQGKINIFDQNVYGDLGETIPTTYSTPWDFMTTKRISATSIKQGKYIKPYFEAGTAIKLTIDVNAPFQGESQDSVTVTAGGGGTIGIAIIGSWQIGATRVNNPKLPLVWTGEAAKFTFTTNTTTGPFSLSKFVVNHTWGDHE